MNAPTTALVPVTRHTIFSPRAQGDFLENLSTNGNVRLACRAARVSPQTAYRARRRHSTFARAWDAALLSARSHAEEVLADRALNGWEEAVFYHGEEIATRRRYSDRLLLAHLARLDRLEERAEVTGTLPLLDDQIDALRRGEGLDASPFVLRQAQHERGSAHSSAQGERGRTKKSAHAEPVEVCAEDAMEIADKDTVPCVPSSRTLPDNLPSLDERLEAMDAARPHGEQLPHQLGDADEVEWLQLAAFESGIDQWWLIHTPETLEKVLE